MADETSKKPHPTMPPTPVPKPRVAPSGAPKVSAHKIKVTAGGAHKTHRVGDQVFTSDPVEFKGSDEELDAMDANPSLVVERYNEHGQLIRQDGTTLPTSTPNNGPPLPPAKEEEEEK